jgi:hypothetical protein
MVSRANFLLFGGCNDVIGISPVRFDLSHVLLRPDSLSFPRKLRVQEFL